jgi:hypothetical protein
MDGQRFIIRLGRRQLWCALGALLALSPGTASAQGLPGEDPCTGNSHPSPIPNCQNQVSLPITFNAGQEANIAYF